MWKLITYFLFLFIYFLYMNASFKKVIAGVTAVTIVAMNGASFVANAAGVNDGAAVVAAGVGITITSASSTFAATCSAVITRTNLGGGTTVIPNTCAVTDGTTLALTAATVAANEYYTVTFSSNGFYGSATAGNTTNNVVVSATVVPTLTMAVSAATIALGTLGTAAYNTAATTVTVSTNANGGTTVAMASTGLKDATINKQIGVTAIGATPQTAATDYYKVSTNASPVIVDGNTTLAAAGGTDMLATQNVYTTAGPVAAAATLVTVGAKIAATTEAGTFADTLTFTVTGSF